jgi:hypothetical protein
MLGEQEAIALTAAAKGQRTAACGPGKTGSARLTPWLEAGDISVG